MPDVFATDFEALPEDSPEGFVYSVGEFLGNHTPAEVAALLAAKDDENTKIDAMGKAHAADIAKKDPHWADDWSAFLGRFKATEDRIHAPVGVAALTANAAWDAIMHALTANPGEPYTDTDQQGLYDRLVRAGFPVDFSKLPQPPPDVDLGTFKQADDLTHSLESGAASLAHSAETSPLVWMGLAGLGFLAIIALRR
jgi:hypothetical protein